MHYLRFITALSVAFSAAVSTAQLHVQPGQVGSDGCAPTTPAQICLGPTGDAHCYSPTSEKDYIFGLEPTAKEVGKLEGQPLVLFTAMFSGCGSGTLTDVSLLTPQAEALVNLLPKVRITNQSDMGLWSIPQISHLPIVATADFVWDFKAGETHFSSHRYLVKAYVFDPTSGKYDEKVSYETTTKYPGLDDEDQVHVLRAEKPTILTKLGQQAN